MNAHRRQRGGLSGGGACHARFTSATVACLVLVAFAGCERQTPQHDPRVGTTAPASTSRPALLLHDWVQQPDVHESERAEVALRIISAAPNVTEICCALGLRSSLVGRTRYCDHPPDISSVAPIGALNDVNVEVLLELHPDLILVSGVSRMQTERFASLGLRFESVPDSRLEDLCAAIDEVGALTGRPLTAQRLRTHIEEELARVTAHYADVPPARVLLLTGTLSDPPRPPYVAGPGSFYDDLLHLAGHTNVVAGSQAAFAPLSLEFIVRAEPDVIIELDADASQRPGGDADARAAWAKVGPLRAADGARVRVLSGNQHYLLGPRIALTYDVLCRAIAGDDLE